MNIKDTKGTIYPTLPDSNGFYFEDENEELLNIKTKEYDNGNLIKQVELKKGKIAIVRELDRKESKKAYEIAGEWKEDKDRLATALIAVSTKIDDKEILMEDVLLFKAKEFNRLSIATQSLNF